jgi:hypothetical protein
LKVDESIMKQMAFVGQRMTPCGLRTVRSIDATRGLETPLTPFTPFTLDEPLTLDGYLSPTDEKVAVSESVVFHPLDVRGLGA